MKVLHVIPSVAPRYGGPSVAIREMASALAARGVSVTVATTDADGPGSLPVPLGVPRREGAADFVYFPRTLPGEWKFSVPLTRWIARHVREFDVVHVHALFSYATLPGCRLARRAGVPYVLRPLGTLTAFSLGSKAWKKAPYLRLVERSHIRGAAAMHVTSDDEARSLAALGFGVRTEVIPLGVRSPVSDPAAALLAREARPGGAPARLLFLSRLHAKKGLPLLFAALAEVERERPGSVELVVAGDGDPAFKRGLHELVQSLGVSPAVRFVGQVGGADKSRLFADSDFFALASDDENFGIAAAEALAAGLPVILSDRVALSRDAQEAGAGLVVTREVAPLAAAIRRLVEDRTLRTRMSERAATMARTTLSWERTAADLERLYDSLRSAARPSAA